MKVQEFLAHHGLQRNPFSEEDAQTDPVFKERCIDSAFHPAWDKIFGDPGEPATSVVFGEKGAGKTAMRMQISRRLSEYNQKHPGEQLFVINYDDFNPFLDRFVNRLPLRRRRVDRALAAWRLWDHMDAILSLGTTQLIDRLLARDSQRTPSDLHRLDRYQRRDMLLLAACYDQSISEPSQLRWRRLRRALHFSTWRARIPLLIGWIGTVLIILATGGLFLSALREDGSPALRNLWESTPGWVYVLVVLVVWSPWCMKAISRFWIAGQIARGVRTGIPHWQPLRRVLMEFTSAELTGQPLPTRPRTDDRYELLNKLQAILRSLGFAGVFVLVDRVDEPYVVNGSAELMRALIWPLLDNKFLKHQGIGVKLMLPAELKYYVDREGREFSQRARLDKQNLVPSLAWSGEALFDIVNARLKACSDNGRAPNVHDLFEENVTRERLIDAFRSLRVPRHLHKFLYHLIVSHCKAHVEESPVWRIPKERFESELALMQRELEADS